MWVVGGGTDGYGRVRRWNGGAWETANSYAQSVVRAVGGSGTNKVFVVGTTQSHGFTATWDGSSWSASDWTSSWNMPKLNAVGAAGGDVWIVGDRGAVGRSPSGSSGVQTYQTDNLYEYGAVWGSGNDDIWAVGYSGVIHWNGTSWGNVAIPSSPTPLREVWGSAPDDVWLAGVNFIDRWSGTAWSQSMPNGDHHSELWGTGANDVWVFGTDAQQQRYARRWDGQAWNPYPVSGSLDVAAASGSGPNDVWAVGYGGVIHWNGSAWSSVASGTTNGLYGVWARTADDAWAVGAAGTIVRWNGTSWTPVASDTIETLNGVWGSGADDVWAVGERGTIVRWNGTAWGRVRSGTHRRLYDVWGSGPIDVWAVGENLTILRWRP